VLIRPKRAADTIRFHWRQDSRRAVKVPRWDLHATLQRRRLHALAKLIDEPPEHFEFRLL